MSDPEAKHWLADDPNFLDRLGDLDQGLLEDGETRAGEVEETLAPLIEPAPPARPVAPPPLAPPPSGSPAAAAPVRARRPINPARALDPARVLDTTPQPREPMAREPAMPSLPPPPTAPAPMAAPPIALAPPSPAEPRARRPLLDVFPPSAPQAERPPMELGTAVGPRLPPPRPRPAPPTDAGAPSTLDGATYETFYGLREKPFSLSTDPKFHYRSAAHERAGEEILAAIGRRGGPALLTAPLGMGKTTLCRALILEMDRRTVTSLVLEPVQSLDDLLKTMLVDFGVVARADLAGAQPSREQLIAALNSFLESLVPLQAGVVVIIDEAQRLPPALLGELAALMGGPSGSGLQLVLAGQPPLTALLEHDDLRDLDASVARRIELGPLAADEISGYVMHRLSIAGAHTRIQFDEPAIAALDELSAGSPRLVNLLCDRAMTHGHLASAAVIDRALIEAAAADLDLYLEAPAGDGPGVLTSILLVACFVLLVIAGAAGALWVSRDAVVRTIEQWEHVPQPPGGPIRRLPPPLAVPAAPAEDFR